MASYETQQLSWANVLSFVERVPACQSFGVLTAPIAVVEWGNFSNRRRRRRRRCRRLFHRIQLSLNQRFKQFISWCLINKKMGAGRVAVATMVPRITKIQNPWYSGFQARGKLDHFRGKRRFYEFLKCLGTP